jgi:hypothetical protein
MARIVRTITTDRPRREVFSYLADFSNAVHWDPGTEQSIPRDADGPKVGQAYDLVVVWGSRKLPMVYETTELVDGERVTFVGDGSTTRAIDTLTFTDLPDGGTQVVYSADISLKWPYRISQPFLGGKFAELGDEAEESLIRVLSSL